VTDSFPMVDAFAPRIRIESHVHSNPTSTKQNTDKRKFLSGRLLKRPLKGSGFVEIDENAPMRYVAAPHPCLAIYSRRIIQRTGGFDTTLPANARLADYTLRMMHAGGKMFSVPYLVAQAENSIVNCNEKYLQTRTAQELNESKVPDLAECAPDLKSTAIILSKTFGFEDSLPFAIRHPSVIPTLLSNRKERKEKRKAATLLSKLTKEYLAEVTE